MKLRIKDLRVDNDLSQQKIADYLHCDQSVYSKYERGIREIPVSLLMDLAKLYNVSMDYLVGFTNDPTPPKNLPRRPKDLPYRPKKRL